MESKTIAVIGASRDHRKFGNKCVRAYKKAGYEVFPVNLHTDKIEGLIAYPALTDVPAELDRISLYLQPELTRQLLAEIAHKGATEVWFNPGSANAQILEEARDAGINVQEGCSILDTGFSPSQFP